MVTISAQNLTVAWFGSTYLLTPILAELYRVNELTWFKSVGEDTALGLPACREGGMKTSQNVKARTHH